MKSAKQIITKNSINDIYKKAVLKLYPELKDKEIETTYKTGLLCPGCGKNESGTLFYRVDNGEWIQAWETMNCKNCGTIEIFNNYMQRSLQEQKNLIAERLTKQYYLLPNHLQNAGFKNYNVVDTITGKAKEQAMEYAKQFLSGKRYNLLIQGSPGTGKSHLCTAIARTVKEKGFIVGFLTTGELLRKIKSTYKKGATETEESIFEDIRKLDLLILDDLGSETIGGNDDWRMAMIFDVVNSRLGKSTIYTSNLTNDMLPNIIGQRVFSRLYDNTKFIDLFTHDYRKKLKVE